MSNHSYTGQLRKRWSGRWGTDTCGQRSNLDKVGYAPTGKHLWTGIRWAWRTLGKALWFAGDGGGGGESHTS